MGPILLLRGALEVYDCLCTVSGPNELCLLVHRLAVVESPACTTKCSAACLLRNMKSRMWCPFLLSWQAILILLKHGWKAFPGHSPGWPAADSHLLVRWLLEMHSATWTPRMPLNL